MITAHDDSFVFSGKTKTLKIQYADILYIEQAENQLWIKKSEKNAELLIISGRVRDISSNLEARFYLCHSYLIINMKRVVSMSKGTVVFDNGDEKHMGRDAYFKTRKAFNNPMPGNR